jgi:hypothetical protein
MSIPKNLDECFEELDRMNIKDINDFLNRNEKDALGLAHHSLGQWIRNNWDLWSVNKTPFWGDSLRNISNFGKNNDNKNLINLDYEKKRINFTSERSY